jgi:hypothetical protein
MNRIIMAVAAATLATLSTTLRAEDAATPSAPALSAAQAQEVEKEMDAYRRETGARVARGEITPDEAQRLLQWREWQLSQQAAGLAPAPPPPASRVVVAPPAPYPPPPYYYPYPYYGPYYAPYYVAPAWGLSVCAGRAFRHGFGSFCI